MKNFLKRAATLIDLLLKWYIVILMTLLVLLTFVQVVARYLMHSPFTSTPQYARLVLVWLTFMGTAMALRRKKLIHIEIIEQRLPVRVKVFLNTFFDFILLCLLFVILLKGWGAAIVTNSQIVAGTPLSYSSFVFSIVVGALIMIFYIIVNFWEQVTRQNTLEP